MITYFVPRSISKMDSFKFNIATYDCIGLDLDHTLARYQLGNLIDLEYYLISNYLINKKSYLPDFLSKPVDTNFIQRGLIIDEEFGNVLKVSSDGTIVKAAHGTKWLSDAELMKYYPTRHREFIDSFIVNPTEAYTSYREKMRVTLDYFDIANSLVFARAVDTIEQRSCTQKLSDIWSDITDALYHMFIPEHYWENKGGYYPELKRNPSRYYRKCSQKLKNWLIDLKKAGKKLFLISGSYAGIGNITATYALGENWRKYFDFVLFGARKPGFFNYRRDFHVVLDNFAEAGKISDSQLQPGGVYSNGSWEGLKIVLEKLCHNQKPKFLYVGDNLIQDVYAPNSLANIDVVAVCEELDAERIFGYSWFHHDKDYLISNNWGSFFSDKYGVSYWYKLLKKHSTFFVPNVEYLADFPLNHKFSLNIGKSSFSLH